MYRPLELFDTDKTPAEVFTYLKQNNLLPFSCAKPGGQPVPSCQMAGGGPALSCEKKSYLYLHNFIHVQSPGSFRFFTQSRPVFGLIYLIDGELRFHVSGRTQDSVLGAHEALFFDYRTALRISAASGPADFYFMVVDGREAAFYFDHYRQNHAVRLPENSRFRQSISFFEKTPPGHKEHSLTQISFLTTLLTELLKIQEAGETLSPFIPEYLKDIKYCFDYEFQKTYSLDELQEKYSVNKYRISKEFIKFFHDSPISYLNSRRIEAARLLLAQTDHRINEISRMVGFENTNHFITQFKKHTGDTPSGYRRNCRT